MPFSMRDTTRKGLRAAAVSGLLATLGAASAACSGQANVTPAEQAQATTARPTPSAVRTSAAAPATGGTPTVTTRFSGGMGYGSVCAGVPSATAAPYRGTGPHPADFEGDPNLANGGGNTATGVADGVLADSDGAQDPDDWRVIKASQVQLVACVTFAPTSTTVGTCSFDVGGDADQNVGDYTVTLYVARTARKLAGPFAVAGTDRACPTAALLNDEYPAVYTALGIPKVVQLLGKYVDATVS